MALSTKDKALAILLGIETARPGTTGKAIRAAISAGARATVAGARFAAPAAPVVGRGALALARQHPAVALGTAGLAAHQLGYLDPAYELLERERQMAAQSYAIAAPTIIPELERTYVAPVKRKVSKANKAVKEGMKWLKGKGKSLTGTAPGVLPSRSFVTATKAAGLANPGTKSKPGKAKTVVNKLAKTLRKWWKR
jgi:hypothetical protein